MRFLFAVGNVAFYRCISSSVERITSAENKRMRTVDIISPVDWGMDSTQSLIRLCIFRTRKMEKSPQKREQGIQISPLRFKGKSL